MKKITSLLSILFVAAIGFVDLSQAERMPDPKSGLWESANFDERGKKLQTSTRCISPESEAKLRELTEDPHSKQTCPKSETTKTKAGYETVSECNIMGSKSVSRSKVTGDLQSAYTMTTVTTMTPPVMGTSRSVSRVEFKWLGDCPPSMKPGDVSVNGSEPVNGVESALRGRKIHDEARKKDPDFDRMVREMAEGEAVFEQSGGEVRISRPQR